MQVYIVYTNPISLFSIFEKMVPLLGESEGYAHKIVLAVENWGTPTITTDTYYYWLLLREYVEPEPAHGAWGAEEAVV